MSTPESRNPFYLQLDKHQTAYIKLQTVVQKTFKQASPVRNQLNDMISITEIDSITLQTFFGLIYFLLLLNL